jgi:hypothetical protein
MAVNFPVQAITLDLDDTLWPVAPIGARIDLVLHEWMREAQATPSRCIRWRRCANCASACATPIRTSTTT